MVGSKIVQRYELCSRGLNGVIKRLQTVQTPTNATLISCVRDEVSGNFVLSFLEPMTYESDWHKRRFFISKDGDIMSYVHFKHVASFGKVMIDENAFFNELHVFEITHPLKVGDDCQEPCEWEDEKDE